MRIAVPGRGKREGGRVVCLYVEVRSRIYFLAVYAKSTRETLSAVEELAVRRLVARLKGEDELNA